MHLKGKKIILAVTGSIAAYKTPELVRQLIKSGAEVQVLLTEAATHFVSELSLATVSKKPVLRNINDGATWNNHVAMGRWADAFIIAPCSANTLAKMANGMCDNIVLAVYLSAVCPVFVAPAMDEDMWKHPTTQSNLERIKKFGNSVLPVGHGELASGLVGDGRMAEPTDIVTFLAKHFESEKQKPLQGTKALVTAGPTYEKLDPVRFIGNYSTGKMGIAIAESLAANGAIVSLILGPTHLRPSNSNIQVVSVESADEMYDACLSRFEDSSISILSAAVADYRPEQKATDKIKKKENTFQLLLTKNKDILATLGKQKKKHQLVVGFALETSHEEAHAWEKLKAKNADMIVLNSLNDNGAGFGHDTNKVTLLFANGSKKNLPLLTKQQVADTIVNQIIEALHVEINH